MLSLPSTRIVAKLASGPILSNRKVIEIFDMRAMVYTHWTNVSPVTQSAGYAKSRYVRLIPQNTRLQGLTNSERHQTVEFFIVRAKLSSLSQSSPLRSVPLTPIATGSSPTHPSFRRSDRRLQSSPKFAWFHWFDNSCAFAHQSYLFFVLPARA